MKMIGKWKSIYIINVKPESLFRAPVGLERPYTKSSMELKPDGSACVADGVARLFKKRIQQYWEGDDNDFAVFWDGGLHMVGEYNDIRYPFESIIGYCPNSQTCIVYKRDN